MSGDTTYYYYDDDETGGWGIYVVRSATPIAWAYKDSEGHVFWRPTLDELREAIANSNRIRVKTWHESAPLIRVLSKSELLAELEA